MRNRVLAFTADIVSAHAAANEVAATEVPALIRDVYDALASLGQALPEAGKAEADVDAMNSVFADHLICLECGGSYKALKTHLRLIHAMTPNEYRDKWGLPASFRLVAAEHAAMRSKVALTHGLGRKPRDQVGSVTSEIELDQIPHDLARA
jgi:predicted transcriptional regulator